MLPLALSLTLSLLSSIGTTSGAADLAKLPAPPLDGGVGYLNTAGNKPLTLAELKGRFVLLDFWTFCCINCMHILPNLDVLETQFADRLTVIGIHSAKFENEKDDSAIRKAIERYGIHHPVINDADFKIWDAYNVKAWPTLVLIDPKGDIVGTYSGEKHTAEIAATIDKLSPIYEADGSLKKERLNLSAKKANEYMRWQFPGKVALGAGDKKLAIAETGRNRIVVADLTEDGKHYKSQTVAFGNEQAGFIDGDSQQARFNHPQGVCIVDDTVYVADTQNNAVRKIDLSTGIVTTVCGDGKQAPSGNVGGKFTAVQLNSPWDIVFKDNKLWVAMAGSHQIWCLDLKTQIASVFAGSGKENLIDSDTLVRGALAQPSGLTFGKTEPGAGDDQSIYIADAEDSGVRQIDLRAGKLLTLIGKGLFAFGDVDGVFAQAKLQHPLGVAYADGKLYLADSYNHKIKSLDLQTKVIQTIAGTGKSGFKDAAIGTESQFAEPGGLAISKRFIYVADTNNGQIRVIDRDSKAAFACSTLSD